jgi:N-acetylglutamate synthase-like GNAT family acetyltransferase
MAWMRGRLLGVGRVHLNSPEAAEAQIRYMAVEEDARNGGIGGKILEELEARARALGAHSIVLNARDKAMRFYEKHGYHITRQAGSLFDAIPHWEMRKVL